MLHCIKRAASDTIQNATTRINTEVNALRDEVAKCREENGHVNLLTETKHDRFWILRTDTHLTGHYPLTNSNDKIVATNLPSDQDIARLIQTPPESKCINIPMTICNLMQYADNFGSWDESLLQVILIFHSPNKYYQVSPKKGSLKSVISALTMFANCEEQIMTFGQELSKFVRHPSEPLSECISKFDSLFTFFQMLKHNVKKDKLLILSKETIQNLTPYLFEQKNAKVFSNWSQECILLKREISKQTIISTVIKLEQNAALKLMSTKHILHHFAMTQLGLDTSQPNVNVQVFVAALIDLPRP